MNGGRVSRHAEAENVVRTLRAGNLQTAVKRLEASRTAIAKLGKMMEMRIGDGFHALRVEEIELTADYLIKKEEEREAARAERERLREERKVEQELAAARERLEKERTHLITVIEKLKVPSALSAGILRDPPRAPGEDVPGSLARVIGRCLMKEPDERFARAGEVAVALEMIEAGLDVARPSQQPRNRRRKRMLAAAGTAIARG